MKKITIVIIDDHKLIREIWSKLLLGNSAYEVIGESGSVTEGVDKIRVTRPDIVFLDINLAGEQTGFDAVPMIRKFSPGTKIIAVSMHQQTAYAKKMMRLGARAYVTKNSAFEEILQAIEEVMKGGKYICSEIKDLIAEQTIHTELANPGLEELTLREIETVKLIKEGHSSKEIAGILNIAIRTVEAHRYNILKKLKLKNTSSLLQYIYNTDLSFI